MGERSGAWLIIGALAVACDGAGGSSAPLEVDVVATATSTLIYVREQQRPCTCSGDELPRPGECIVTSDAIRCTCEPAPGSCLSSIRLERDGAVVDEANLDGVIGGLGFGAVTLVGLDAQSGVTELVLEGCGGSARVALPDAAHAPVAIAEVSNNTSKITVTVAPEGANHTITSIDSGYGGPRCHSTTPAPAGVWASFLVGFDRSVEVLALDDGDDHDTELGTVRVWRGAVDRIENVYITKPVGDGTWRLPYGRPASLALTIDGEPQELELRQTTGTVDPRGALPLVSIQGPAYPVAAPGQPRAFDYRAGGAMDTLTYEANRTYSGTFPHVEPDPAVALGTPGWTSFDLTIPTVTLTSDLDPSDTIDVSFALSWPLGVVSKPLLE